MSAVPVLSDLESSVSPIELPPMGETASGRKWRLREADGREALAISQMAGVERLVGRVLAARGVMAADAVAYLNPSLRDALPDPFVLTDMEKAAERLANAIVNQESVGVFGDYDVDGTTAAAIFKSYFKAINTPMAVYLPDRITEGYGPTIEAFHSLKSDGVKVIITVDCGASAHGPVNEAAKDDLDIVVIDHHLMSEEAPQGAVAVVNPNRPDDFSGLTNLSAAGVAFMAIVALNRALRERGYFKDKPEPDIRRFLDLAALGLVCDVMEMTGLTRVLTAQGLKVLGARGNPGLAALGKRSGVKGAPSTYHLGFLLGPRINAAGRIGHARLAFDLLTSEDPVERDRLAEKLHAMNATRQEIEADVQQAALSLIEKNDLAEKSVIVVAGEGWHPGVIGIVAGRLKEKYDRPVIVIALDGETGKGSGRSIGGVDLGSAISKARSEGLLINGGGHAMAAGLTIAADTLEAFADTLEETLSADIAAAKANRTLDVDGVIAPSAVSKPFAEIIAKAGPFGPGNPEPLFALTDMQVKFAKIVGKGHLSLTLSSAAGETVRAIAFRAEGEKLGAILAGNHRVHVAGKVRADDWRGGEAGQLQITDAALAQ